MALATLGNLARIGALPVDYRLTELDTQKAQELLEDASAIVCAYFGVDEEDVAEWSTVERSVVATVTAQCAALGLSFPAAATAQQVLDSGIGVMRMRLTDSMKTDLAMIKRGRQRGTRSLPVTLGDDSTMSWERNVYDGTW